MLERLKVTNLPSGVIPEHSGYKSAFVLKTCQRTLIIENNILSSELTQGYAMQGKEAYQFLLEVICGLQSKLLGENEIVSQFKEAYKLYSVDEYKCNTLLSILEKLFKDAKEIRTRYLIGLGQKTYSSIARRHVVNKNKASKVLILGSGQLAIDLINQFKKKVPVYVSARNPQKLKELKESHGIETVDWLDFGQYSNFPYIVNSIGCSKGAFLDENLFTLWASKNTKKLFIDLGFPSVVDTNLSVDEGVMRLDDIFKEGAIKEEYKQQQILKAQSALKEIVIKRNSCLNQKSKNKERYVRNKECQNNTSSEPEEASSQLLNVV